MQYKIVKYSFNFKNNKNIMYREFIIIFQTIFKTKNKYLIGNFSTKYCTRSINNKVKKNIVFIRLNLKKFVVLYNTIFLSMIKSLIL